MNKAIRILTLLGLCSVLALAHTVSLSWTASTSSGVSGYNVKRSTVSGGPYTKINSSLIFGLTYTDSTVVNGQTYYYVATAQNTSGVESVNSTQVGPEVIPGPKITTFSASPTSITAGGSSTLTISTSNATSCSINQGIGTVTCNGTQTVTPSVTTTYTLSITDGTATTTATVTVVVTAVVSPPTISSFVATPASIGQGSTSTLGWNTTGGTTCSINQGIGTVSCNATHVVTPTVTTTYTLTATNTAGSVTKTVTVTVTLPKPVITSFTATPSQLFKGQSATLSWAVTGAVSLSIDQGVGTVTGTTSKVISSIQATTTYTLTATNANGSVSQPTTVTILISCSSP